MPKTPATAATSGGRGRLQILVLVLAVTQTVGYGVLYYSVSVLLQPIATDLHASTAEVAGAATVSILMSAAAAIPVGRWLDRHGGRTLMTAGSALGVAAVLAWSRVEALWQLYAVFALIGIASAACLYEAAFPVIIQASDPRHRDRALLAITIVAGFASTIFFPLTGLLLVHLGWRSTVVVLMAILATLTIPGHLLAVPAGSGRSAHASTNVDAPVSAALRDARFWILAAGFVVQTAATSAVGVLLVTFLRHAGYSTVVAATASGMLGVLSVTGRLATTGLARRYGMATVTAAVFVVQAVGAGVLPRVTGSLTGVTACITAFGLGFGVATIARPAIIADRYGTARYATVAATMAVPIALAKAIAPLAAAGFGDGRFLDGAAAACLLAAACLWVVGRSPARPPHPLPDRQVDDRPAERVKSAHGDISSK